MPYIFGCKYCKKNGLTYPTSKYLLDIVTGASVAYGIRKMKSTATRSVRVRRSSDNAEIDVGFTGANIDTATLLSHCGTYSGYVTTWYDQAGANNATQSTAGYQPRIVNAGTYDAGLVFDGADSYFSCGSIFNNVLNSTIYAEVKPSGVGETPSRIIDKGLNLSKLVYMDASYRIVYNQAFSLTAGTWNTNLGISTSVMNKLTITNTMTTTSDPAIYSSGATVAITEATAPGGNTMDDSAQVLYIGNRLDRARAWAGYINSILMFPRILSDSEIAKINA